MEPNLSPEPTRLQKRLTTNKNVVKERDKKVTIPDFLIGELTVWRSTVNVDATISNQGYTINHIALIHIGEETNVPFSW